MSEPLTLRRNENMDRVNSVIKLGGVIVNVTSVFGNDVCLYDLLLSAARGHFTKNMALGSDKIPFSVYNQTEEGNPYCRFYENQEGERC